MGVHGYSKQNTSNPGGTFRVQRRAVETEGEKVAASAASASASASSAAAVPSSALAPEPPVV